MKIQRKTIELCGKTAEIAGKSHEKDSLYKQTEARIEEICKNLEYKTYKDASKEQQRLSDEIDQMKFNKEEIEKKKKVLKYRSSYQSGRWRKRKYTFECYKTVGRTERDERRNFRF